MPLSSLLYRSRATVAALVRSDGIAGRLVVAWLAFTVLLGGYWLQLDHSHTALVSQAESLTRLRALQTAHALALHTGALFRKLDYLSLHLGEHWLKEGPQGARDALVRAHLALPEDALVGIDVADARGGSSTPPSASACRSNSSATASRTSGIFASIWKGTRASSSASPTADA